MLITELPEPGAGMVTGLKPMVVPVGTPEAERLIALLKPLVTVVVIVELPCVPCIRLTDAGEAEMENVDPADTVRLRVPDC